VPDYNQMSDAEEVAFGRAVVEQLETQQLNLLDHARIQEYVNGVFQKVVASSRRPNLPYSIKVVDTREINAFALPGGFVFLNRGMLEWVRSESELTAVLSHEVGHVVGRHSANAVTRTAAAGSLVGEASRMLFGDDLPARVLKQIGGPVAVLALLKYSRSEELEADLLGYYNLQRAGWHPSGLVDLFKHLGEGSTALDLLLSITSTHPAPRDRENQIASEMRQFPPVGELVHQSEALAAVQAELRTLPPPRGDRKRTSH
jgi:beta-barrel assembly-enhancing protease